MRHVPWVHLPGPWDEAAITLDRVQANHLGQVLRLREGDPVEYTDGAGTWGAGTLSGAAVERGTEAWLDLPPRLVVAVAPLRSKDRMRFLVEKLTEMAVTEVWWLETAFSQASPPRPDRVAAWAVAGLEQSRGSWLPTFRAATWADVLASELAVHVLDGSGVEATPSTPCLLVVGPEGGFSPTELPDGIQRLRLTGTVLRTETAAILGAGLVRVRSM